MDRVSLEKTLINRSKNNVISVCNSKEQRFLIEMMQTFNSMNGFRSVSMILTSRNGTFNLIHRRMMARDAAVRSDMVPVGQGTSRTG